MVAFITQSNTRLQQIFELQTRKEMIYAQLGINPEDGMALLQAIHAEFYFLQTHKQVPDITDADLHGMSKEVAQGFETACKNLNKSYTI